jgi:hypothetical protein
LSPDRADALGRGKAWYFMIATCGPNGFRTDQVVVGDRDEGMRAAYMAELVRRHGLAPS